MSKFSFYTDNLKFKYLRSSGKSRLSGQEQDALENLKKSFDDLEKSGCEGFNSFLNPGMGDKFDLVEICSEMELHIKAILNTVKNGRYRSAAKLGM